jgi:glycosyltransferase involved in cell wall biosynthesis
MAVHLVCGLDRKRFEVGVVSLCDRTDSRQERIVSATDTKVWFLGKKPGFDARMFVRLDRVIRQFRPRIIHTHLRSLWYSLPVSWPRQIVAVHTIHGMADRDTHPAKRMVNRLAWARVVPVSVAAQVSVSLRRVYGLNATPTIPNGIPLQQFQRVPGDRPAWRRREGFQDEDVLFTCAARMQPIKNHALLLAAFAEGPARDPRCHLLFAGRAESTEELRVKQALHASAERLGVGQRVRFLGERQDTAQLYSASDVFVLGSHSEANPLSVMEAMAAGLPVVATAVGGVPELVEDRVSGVLVKPGDSASMATAMLALLRDEELRHSMGTASQKTAAQRFDVSRMVNAYSSLYEALACSEEQVC